VKRASLFLASAVAVAACADTTPAPVAPSNAPAPVASASVAPAAPADPDPVTEGDVTVAWTHGMEILVKRTPGAEFVGAQLSIRGGTRNWTAENAGIEQVALEVATSGGTQSLDKHAYSQKLASLGATIVGDAGNDSSSITAKAPMASWDDLFPIFVDTFLAPALPASEFEIVKQRELSGRRHETEDGDGRLWLLARRAVFAGHPYANRAIGSVASLTPMTADALAPHLVKLRDTNRLVLVVVGDVDPAHVIDRARKAFASVPRGTYVDTPLPQLHFTGSHLSGDPFKLPTNYIEAVFAGPAWSDPDFAAMVVGMDLLGQRMFDEVRTKRNLSYSPSAGFEYGLSAPFGRLYVTAVDPNTTMKVMFDQVKRLQTEPIPASELDGTKATFVSRLFQWHEPADWMAADLSSAILLGGDWHHVKTFPDQIRATTPEDVRRVAAKWITNTQTAIVGDPTKLDPKVVGAQ
jgi:zinc protease